MDSHLFRALLCMPLCLSYFSTTAASSPPQWPWFIYFPNCVSTLLTLFNVASSLLAVVEFVCQSSGWFLGNLGWLDSHHLYSQGKVSLGSAYCTAIFYSSLCVFSLEFLGHLHLIIDKCVLIAIIEKMFSSCFYGSSPHPFSSSIAFFLWL